MARRRLDVNGRTVFVTGAARGIGGGVAERMHSKGANVALVGLEPDLLEERAAKLGDRAAWFEADVTDTGCPGARSQGHGRALRRHRRRGRQRGHPHRRLADHRSARADRADHEREPVRRLAHGPRGPPARDRAQGLPAQHRVARRGGPRAPDGPLRGVEGRRRGAHRLAPGRAGTDRGARRLRVLRLHRDGSGEGQLRAPIDQGDGGHHAGGDSQGGAALGRRRRDRAGDRAPLRPPLGSAVRRRRAGDPGHHAAADRDPRDADASISPRRSAWPTRPTAAWTARIRCWASPPRSPSARRSAPE